MFLTDTEKGPPEMILYLYKHTDYVHTFRHRHIKEIIHLKMKIHHLLTPSWSVRNLYDFVLLEIQNKFSRYCRKLLVLKVASLCAVLHTYCTFATLLTIGQWAFLRVKFC